MKIAIVQDGPVYLNAQATLDKTLDLMTQAAKEKVDLIVFGENWFSGYPLWLDICKDVSIWDHPPIKDIWAKTFENGLAVGSDTFNKIAKAAKEASMYVVIGANEPISTGLHNGTIFNTIYTINADGQLVNHHRKLVPTYTEKLVHGPGDGAGLKAVDTRFGRLGSLICWEHWMPLTRQAMHNEGEDLHIALWPYAKELHQVASRHYAHEGRCHVVAVGQVMHQGELPNTLTISDVIDVPKSGYLLRGGCSVYGPGGDIIMAPVYDKRSLIITELDLRKNLAERMNLAVSGHYQRHDIFQLDVNKKRHT